jgi:hypothetical protein
VALWYYPDFNIKLSGAVAGVLADEKKFDLRRLELLRELHLRCAVKPG